MIAPHLGFRTKTLGFSALGLAALVVLTASCGGDGATTLHTSVLSCAAGTSVSPGHVGMQCGTAAVNDVQRVDVVLQGPSSGSLTVRGFNFDITYDPAKIQFVPAQGYASALFPNGLAIAALADGQQGRVIVSVQQTGDREDVTVESGPHEIISLWFEAAPGATFGGAGLEFENAEATSSSSSIQFGSDLSLSYQ